MTPTTSTPAATPKKKKSMKTPRPAKAPPRKSGGLPSMSELRAATDEILSKAPSSSTSAAPPAEAEGFSSSLVRPLRNTSPFLKWGIVGDAHAPCLAVAVDAAVGIHKRERSRRPVVVVDADAVARFHIPTFDKAGVQALHMESRSLADLGRLFDEVDAIADVVIIHNVTGYYDDVVEAYKARHQVDKLGATDWTAIKAVWRQQFSRPFRALRAHAFFTGRITDHYATVVNEDGAAESMAVGTKLRAEKETAYDADLFLELIQREEEAGAFDDAAARVVDVAVVRHDESGQMRGQRVGSPTFASFADVVAVTLANGQLPGAAREQASTADLFGGSRVEHRRKIALLDEIKVELDKIGSPRVPFVQAKRAAALNGCFRTSVWSTIELLDTDELIEGLDLLRQAIADGGANIIVAGAPAVTAAGAAAVDAVRAVLSDDAIARVAVGGDIVGARNRAVTAANSVAAHLTEPHRSTAVDVIKATTRSWRVGTGGRSGSGGGPPRPPTDS